MTRRIAVPVHDEEEDDDAHVHCARHHHHRVRACRSRCLSEPSHTVRIVSDAHLKFD
jgi:hypothetical protein